MAGEEGRGCFGVGLDGWGSFQNQFQVLGLKKTARIESNQGFSHMGNTKSPLL